MIFVILQIMKSPLTPSVLLPKDKGNLLPAYKKRDFVEGSTDGRQSGGSIHMHSMTVMSGFTCICSCPPEPEQGLYLYRLFSLFLEPIQ